MTIYIHFRNRETAEKLHNVAAVVDNGVHAVRVDFIFSDENRTFENVSHVSLQPQRED
jgi:hypothetical protein